MYIYESHMGDLYATQEPLNDDELYCETCGDSDTYLGCANNKKEAKKLLGNDKYIRAFIDKMFAVKVEIPPISINRYRLKPGTTLDNVKQERFKDGGSWINENSVLYKSITLIEDSVVLDIGFHTVEDWNDFDYVLVLDDNFLQPYTPFYGDNYGKTISNFEYLQRVIQKYNDEMDKLSFLERV